MTWHSNHNRLHASTIGKLHSPPAISVTGNPYKYGGKEFDTFGGTDLYDFHARYHAPSTGRFMPSTRWPRNTPAYPPTCTAPETRLPTSTPTGCV